MLLVKVFRTLLVLGLVMPLDAGGRGQAVSVKLDRSVRRKESTVRLILDQKLLTPLSPASSIANMSLSPWTYRDTCEESRFPRHMSQARCLISGCLNLQGGGGGGEDMGLESKPIYYQTLVLHRVQRDVVGEDNSRGRKSGVRTSGNNTVKKRKQRYAFRLGTEVIAVGCTCVRPSTVLQK